MVAGNEPPATTTLDLRLPDPSAERFGPESLPELGVALSKALRVVRKALAGRPRPTQASLRLGIIAYVTVAALFFEDFSRDVVDLLELPYAVGTGLHIPLRQAFGICQCSLVDVTPPRYE